MKSINFARLLRVFAVLALILVVPGELQNNPNIEGVFAVEVVLITIIILTTRIIEIEKSVTQ
jgi:hypothetical protein